MDYKELYKLDSAPNSEKWGITLDEVNEIISNLDPINTQWFDDLNDDVHIVAAPFTKGDNYDKLTLGQILGAIVADIDQVLPFFCVAGYTKNVAGDPYIYVEELAVVPKLLKFPLRIAGIEDVDVEDGYMLVSYHDLLNAALFYQDFDDSLRGKKEFVDLWVDDALKQFNFKTSEMMEIFLRKYITI